MQSFVSFDYPFLSWSKISRNGWQTSKRERESRVVHPSYDHVTRMAPTASATALNAERDSGTRNVPMPADYARGRREGNHVFYPHFQSVVVCPVGRLVLYYTRPSLVFSLLRSFLFLWSVFSSWFTHYVILILAPNSSLFPCNTAAWRESFDGYGIQWKAGEQCCDFFIFFHVRTTRIRNRLGFAACFNRGSAWQR